MTEYIEPEIASDYPEPSGGAQHRQPSRSTMALTVLAAAALAGGVAFGRITAPTGAPSKRIASVLVPQTTPNTQSPDYQTPDTQSPDTQVPGDSNGDTTGNGGTADVNGVAAKVAPAIVNINTVLRNGNAAGTGMLVTSSGELLTNNHVIDGATQISVELADGSRHSAKVLGYDAADDVALVKINGVSGLPTIKPASASPSVGDQVVALGNALGKGGAPSVVTGSVTAVGQTITASGDNGENAETLSNLIQTDAPIEPGDSGGPLVNADGSVVGMDAAASTDRGFGFRQSSTSQGFAIPIDSALAIARQIDAGNGSGSIHIGERGVLGIEVQPDSQSAGGPGGGAVIAGVASGSPAEGAGIQQGDSIVAIDATSVDSASQLSTAMSDHHPGDKVSVTWVDGSGSRHSATLRLMTGPPA